MAYINHRHRILLVIKLDTERHSISMILFAESLKLELRNFLDIMLSQLVDGCSALVLTTEYVILPKIHSLIREALLLVIHTLQLTKEFTGLCKRCCHREQTKTCNYCLQLHVFSLQCD